MQQKRNIKWILVVCLLSVICIVAGDNKVQAKKKVYTIGTKTKPCDKEILKKVSYNKNTRNYYTIQSYLNKLEETGGTLKLKKGTYKIPSTIFVPSNVTIQCKNGVKITKTTKTGSKKLKTTSFLFQTISEEKSWKKRKIGKYKASKNVVIKGGKNVIFDLGNIKESTGIYVGHGDGVTIQNITFKNKNGGSYIWVEGSRNITISKCTFQKGKVVTGAKNQMAIRLEVINKTTSDFTGKWSKFDNTVNRNISIDNNQFQSLEVGVGAVKYVSTETDGKLATYYQTGIKITNNTFIDMSKYAVKAVGWKGGSIANNTMNVSNEGIRTPVCVVGFGVYNPSIRANAISGCSYAIQFGEAMNAGKGKKMPSLISIVEPDYINKLENNTVKDVSHYYVALNGIRIMYFKNKEDKNFVIQADTTPYHEKYTDLEDYEKRKYYYIFTSYMEQLEYAGGGTITVQAGYYPITNNICIPSNVTMTLCDGVTFAKSGTTLTDICYAKSIFSIVPPSKDGLKEVVSGYNGSQNVQIIGNGTVIIDCANVLNSMALIMGHANNVSIRGITFKNQNGSHFIELNSSQNVTVENCRFIGFTPYEMKSHKECINIDGTDYNTGGFNYDWSTHDKTACKNIFIRNNYFENIGTAVGSHTYMAEGELQIYHENVQVYENEVNGTYNAAVRALNWKDCIIKNNMFRNIQSLGDGKLNSNGEQTRYVAMLLRGVVNPVVTENTFNACNYYPIRVIMSTPPTSDNMELAGYPDTISVISEENWALMQKNTVIDMKDKFSCIVVRENSTQADSVAEKKEFLAE